MSWFYFYFCFFFFLTPRNVFVHYYFFFPFIPGCFALDCAQGVSERWRRWHNGCAAPGGAPGRRSGSSAVGDCRSASGTALPECRELAVLCRTVLCCALPCRAVLCCAPAPRLTLPWVCPSSHRGLILRVCLFMLSVIHKSRCYV